MAPKRKKSAPASGGGRRGGGGGIGRKSNKAVRQQTPDSSYVPKKREDTTGRLGKPKRAAASKANEVIQQAADALLTKENGNTYHIDDVPSNSPRAEAKTKSDVGGGLKLKLKNTRPTQDDISRSHISSSNLNHPSVIRDDDFPSRLTLSNPNTGGLKLKLTNTRPTQDDDSCLHLSSSNSIRSSATISNPNDTATFIESISKDIGKIFSSLLEEEDIQTELPDLFLPNHHGDIDSDSENGLLDIMDEWTSERLFHLYLLAYSQDNWNICDLVADTWIREFQIAGPRMWKENKTEYGRDMKDKPLINLGNAYLNNKKVTSFEPDRLRELYLHTRATCGARFLWADALALCGSKLENLLDRPEMSQHAWHHDLIWNVMRTSLRLTRVRLTLKIEERDADSWCARYPEHGKWDKPCYRVLAAEQERRKREPEREMMKEKADKDDFDMEMESDQMTTTHGVLNMGNRHAREANLHENGHESGGQASAGEDAMGRHVSFMGVDDGLLNEADFMAAWDEDDSGNEM